MTWRENQGLKGSSKARSISTFLAGAACATNLAASAALFIDVGNILVEPNRSDQEIQIRIRNTGPDPVAVAGLNFVVQVNDGVGAIPGPAITGIDLVTGTPFLGNNTGQFNHPDDLPQFASATVTINLGGSPVVYPVDEDVLLATLTIDTTGFGAGSWQLRLGDTMVDPTFFYDPDAEPVFATINDGTLTAVPEPAFAATTLAIGALAFAILRRIR
jgi:hypothetical protein